MRQDKYWKWCGEEADKLLGIAPQLLCSEMNAKLSTPHFMCPKKLDRNRLRFKWTNRDDAGFDVSSVVYDFYDLFDAKVLIASRLNSICFLGFVCVTEADAYQKLQASFPAALLERNQETAHIDLLYYLRGEINTTILQLELIGTNFQLKVWKALTQLAYGEFVSYKDVGSRIGIYSGFQAIGAAVGKNPIAYIVPCHRVINTSGELGGFRWGIRIKLQLLIAEIAVCKYG